MDINSGHRTNEEQFKTSGGGAGENKTHVFMLALGKVLKKKWHWKNRESRKRREKDLKSK